MLACSHAATAARSRCSQRSFARMRSSDCFSVRSTAANSYKFANRRQSHNNTVLATELAAAGFALQAADLGRTSVEERLNLSGKLAGHEALSGRANDARDHEGAVKALVQRRPIVLDIVPEQVPTLVQRTRQLGGSRLSAFWRQRRHATMLGSHANLGVGAQRAQQERHVLRPHRGRFGVLERWG